MAEVVAIFCDAMSEDIITRFIYGHRRKRAVYMQAEFFTQVLRQKFTKSEGSGHVIKAVSVYTSEILGWSFICWRIANGQSLSCRFLVCRNL